MELLGEEAGRCLEMREEYCSGQEGRTMATRVFWVDGPDKKIRSNSRLWRLWVSTW